MSRDILFTSENDLFSYRVAGILIRDEKVLLQKPEDDDGYALPGGHVSFGETSSETLVREFKEEANADIEVDRLALVCEIFFPWGDRPCQQVCLYYTVSLRDESQIPLEGTFPFLDGSGDQRVKINFSWIPLSEITSLKIYPPDLKKYLRSLPEHIEYFVYRENESRVISRTSN